VSSLRTKLTLPLVALVLGVLALLTTLLWLEVAPRLVDGERDALLRSFVLLAAAAGVLVTGLVMWHLGRALAPVEAIAAELPRLEHRLGGALEREREFSGHLAHELRTPLAVLRTGLDLALRKQPAGSDAHAHTIELLATVDEMNRLTDNLLLLARVERGADSTRLQPVAVRPIVEAIWRRFESKAEGRGLTFENRLDEDHRIDADRGKLQIVLQNLLANAVSYTESGGAIVVEHDEHVLLAVWDSGPQLPDEQRERVFDRLWRADLARTDATQHAGLGLSLARALCRHMALELTAENVATGGLRFAITRAGSDR
jgi:signal transduction histidine kinase